MSVGEDYNINQSVVDDAIIHLRKDIENKLNDLFIKGLERKGFIFNNKKEIEDFIKKRCVCVMSYQTNEKTYLVDNIPFLLYIEDNNLVKVNNTIERDYRLTIDHGFYSFL